MFGGLAEGGETPPSFFTFFFVKWTDMTHGTEPLPAWMGFLGSEVSL